MFRHAGKRSDRNFCHLRTLYAPYKIKKHPKISNKNSDFSLFSEKQGKTRPKIENSKNRKFQHFLKFMAKHQVYGLQARDLLRVDGVRGTKSNAHDQSFRLQLDSCFYHV